MALVGAELESLVFEPGGTLQNFTRSCCLLEFLTSCFRASCSLDKNGIPKRSRPMLVQKFSLGVSERENASLASNSYGCITVTSQRSFLLKNSVFPKNYSVQHYG